MSDSAEFLHDGDQQDFTIDDLSTGPHAHGFGRTGDGRTYAFRVRRSTLHLEIYRADVRSPVPGQDDVEAVAQCSVREVDLSDERSVVAVVRDAVADAQPVDGAPGDGLTVRAFLSRIGSVIDGM
ncbi:hypothetical protein G4X40_13450 [Rhodococcus sp. D2-41]|uniref:Uncharacterized protein n=1 Tax=Speluncibacter jeojiensis TaxID=2710754 RepID=A0A9X4M801_9ACTN|nr:hypothetical protein [Rhodococcus sp. D2-41]MDG3011157.1 hypothetical protein [Rhodococcus sp. D2-41]MDG3015991.1 hypothetical protein [Corynebacteriales bacterium D3-21]